jgi:hypothetical protein
VPLRPVGRFPIHTLPNHQRRDAPTDEAWQASWDEALVDHEAYREAGEGRGLPLAVAYADAYPGLKYVANSDRARMWSERLGHDARGWSLETNVYSLDVLFHDLVVTQVAWYDAERDGLIDSSGAVIVS